MSRKRNILRCSALVAPVIAVTIAGCGGSDNDSSGNNGYSPPAASATASTQRSGGATVDVRSSGELGKILVDSKGRTLYLFEKDTGPKSTCSGACASAWPPFTTTGKPKAGAGAKASLVGTTMRSDGTREITYNGHPLYYYAGDQAAGDTNGQALDQFGAEWYVLSPAGNTVEAGTSS
jgi:predicted lipoprotein with Yx(FWY)xxD motif